MRAPLALAWAGLRCRRRGSTALLAALCTVSAIGVIAGLTVLSLGARTLDRVADDARVAHLVVFAEPDAAAEVARDPRLVEVSAPLPSVTAALDDRGSPITTRITGVAELPGVSTPQVRSGTWLQGPDDVVLEVGLAEDTGWNVGSTVTVTTDTLTTTVRVVGTAVDLTDCAYPQCMARMYATPSLVARLGGSYVELLARLDDVDRAESVAGDLLGQPGVLGAETWPDTRNDYLTIDRIFGGFVTALGVFLMFLVAIVLTASTSARLIARRRELALLKTAGATPREIAVGVVGEHLAIGAIGVFVGWVLGTLLAPRLVVGVGRVIEPDGVRWSVVRLGIAAVVVGGALVIATVLPAWRAGRTPVTEVLRDAPHTGGRHAADRLTARVRTPPTVERAVHDAGAHPLHHALGTLVLTVAVVGAVAAAGIIGSMRASTHDHARTGDPWDVVVARDDATPSTVEAAVAATPGIRGWYTLSDDTVAMDGSTFRARALGGDPAAAAYDIGAGRAATEPGEATVGWGFMDTYGVGIGDDITFELDGHEATVRIVGWHRDTTDSGVTLLWRDDQRRRIDPGAEPSTWRITIADDASPDAVRAALEQRLGSSVRVQTFDSGTDLGPFVAAMTLVALLGATVALLHLASSTVARVRDAARGIGVLRTLGVTDASLLAERAVGGLLGAVPAAVVGLPLGLVVLRVVSDTITESIGAGPGFVAPPSAIGLVAIGAACVGVAAVAGVLGTVGLLRRPTADLIRAE